MSTLVLSSAGAAVGGLFGPVGSVLGQIAGAALGGVIDNALFGSNKVATGGPRLGGLDVMSSSEGAPVPRVYGRVRVAGQVIWATQLEEVATAIEPAGGGKGMGAPVDSGANYTYFANFAVGLCEGVIGRVARIWADGKPLDLDGINYRVYRGSEDQAADWLIVAKQGAGNAPAYRGLAYVVFERLPLENFGNRIPQLSFEVVRPIGLLEQMTRAVTLIPGTTEFGYEPSPVVQVVGPGQAAPENRHVGSARSDVVAALDDLQGLCPNLERVAIVVSWFGSDLRAAHCEIRPGVENAAKITDPLAWSVQGVTRSFAYLVSQPGGRPAFGGTPSDASVLHLIAELKARGLKITLYPFVMMDIPEGNALPDPWSDAASQPAYPWRGRISCHPAPGVAGSPQGTVEAGAQVDSFFAGGVWNYRRLVLHYAQLAALAGGVGAFLIGSELRGLTRVRSGPGIYPAVTQLAALASDVKAILGSTVVTYGADWTEYGADVVTPDGSEVRFPLDTLWGAPAIDAVGIDYYAPLADWRDGASHLDRDVASSIYDRAYLRSNVTGGEAYDWFYPDDAARGAQARQAITDGLGKAWMFRVKDLAGWWSNYHDERVGGVEIGATAWVPQSKPIWLTEVGCPAVDKGANQPSVFPDPKSSENLVPHFSSGARDDVMQRRYIEALLSAFDPAFGGSDTRNPVSVSYGGRMIDVSASHLWTWDARPYPVFPAAEDVWADGANWHMGHWLNGRIGGAPLDALVERLATDSGVVGIDASRLLGGCDGYAVDRPMAPRAMIEPLAATYAFNATAADGVLRFMPRGGDVVVELSEDDLVAPEQGALAQVVRAQETELPRQVGIGFSDALTDYRRGAVTSRKLVGGANRLLQADLAIITSEAAATQRAEVWLQDLWAGRERAEFSLGKASLALAPGDVIALTSNGRRRVFEIGGISDAEARRVTARSIDPDLFDVPLLAPVIKTQAAPPALGPVQAVVLNLPVIDGGNADVLTRLAVFANPWPGGVTIWQSKDAASFQVAAHAPMPAVIGETLDALPAGPVARWDNASSMRVRLYGGVLTSLSDARVFGGGNAAAVQNDDGQWEIFQFAQADLVDERTYRLSRLLRGQAGSEQAMAATLYAGARFVLLDASLVPIAHGLDALDRPLSLRLVGRGRSADDASATALTVAPDRTALLPLAPSHVKAIRTSDGVHVSWVRRTRIDGDGWANEVPLGENGEAYRLDILAGGTVKRSIACTTPQAIYTAADEVADFGTLQASLDLRVSQISATVGPGRATEVTVNV